MWIALIVLAVVAVAVVVVMRSMWASQRTSASKPHDQDPVAAAGPGENHPDFRDRTVRAADGDALPGSQEDRARHGKP